DLNDSPAPPLRLEERLPLCDRHRQRLLDETILARGKTHGGQGKMTVCRRDEIDRIDVREGITNALDRARGSDAGAHRKGATLGREICDPEVHAELGEHAEVLLAPTAEADEEHPHGRRLSSSASPSAAS